MTTKKAKFYEVRKRKFKRYYEKYFKKFFLLWGASYRINFEEGVRHIFNTGYSAGYDQAMKDNKEAIE